jgi:hypothetical protein
LARSKKTNQNRRKKQPARTGPKLTADQRLVNAQEIFEAIRHAVEDFEDAQTVIRSKTAVRNFVEQARSLSWALQHLKSERSEPAQWDEWWQDATSELREDKIAQWFYNLRNPIVKEGHPVEINRATALAEREFVLKGDEPRPEGAEDAKVEWHPFCGLSRALVARSVRLLVSALSRIPLGRGIRGWSVVFVGCRTPRCTRRRPSSGPVGMAMTGGARAPS